MSPKSKLSRAQSPGRRGSHAKPIVTTAAVEGVGGPEPCLGPGPGFRCCKPHVEAHQILKQKPYEPYMNIFQIYA